MKTKERKEWGDKGKKRKIWTLSYNKKERKKKERKRERKKDLKMIRKKGWMKNERKKTRELNHQEKKRTNKVESN